MATLQQLLQQGNVKDSLPGWGYYLGNEVDAGNTQNKYGQQFLADVQKYDPSAHWEFVRTDGGGGEGGSGDGTTYMRMAVDRSKLPNGGEPGMVDMNPGAYAGFRDDPNAGYGGHLYRDDLIGNDANYGAVTSPRNQNLVADNDTGWAGKYGPMIIALIASMGAAAPALMAGEGLAAFSGGLGVGGQLTAALPSIAGAADRGDWLSALLSAAGPAAGMAGIPSYLTSTGSTLARLFQQQQQQHTGHGPGG